MLISPYISPTKPPLITLACISNNSTNKTTPIKPPLITLACISNNSTNKTTPIKPPKKKSKQLSVAEVEQAIGAGIYRDSMSSETRENKNVMDVVLSNTIGKTEGPIERKLRETGEWMNTESEKAARSSVKKILEIMLLWIAPAWFLLFLVATGAIKLPSSFTALNDLIM